MVANTTVIFFDVESDINLILSSKNILERGSGIRDGKNQVSETLLVSLHSPFKGDYCSSAPFYMN